MTIVLIGLVVMIFLGFVLKNLIKERKEILAKSKPEPRHEAKPVSICALCQHISLRTDPCSLGMDWVHKKICTAAPPKADYVTGQPDRHRLCVVVNIMGDCERFRPIRDEE